MTEQRTEREILHSPHMFTERRVVEIALEGIDGKFAGVPLSDTDTAVYMWNGKFWERDRSGKLKSEYLAGVIVGMQTNIARAIDAGMYDEQDAKIAAGFSVSLDTHRMRENILAELKAELPHTATSFEDKSVNADTPESEFALWLFNVQNGTLELNRPGGPALRPHDSNDHLTQIAPVEYDPSATCPAFERFLEDILPDAPTRSYVQELLGYALNGHTNAELFPLFYGTGSNGKSTLLEAVMNVFGRDYAVGLSGNVFRDLGDRAEHPVSKLRVKGRRLVIAAETSQDMRLDDQAVKEMTAREWISAREMRAAYESFRPTHMVIMQTNHAPVVKGTDKGIWRRLREVPFTVFLPPSRIDTTLPRQLKLEASGILNWLLEGHRRWYDRGEQFDTPPSVTRATEQYRVESDELAAFVEDYLRFAPELRTPTSKIHLRYKIWAEREGHRRIMRTGDLTTYLRRKYNLETCRIGRKAVRGLEGVGLREDDDPHNTPEPPPSPKGTTAERTGDDPDVNDMYVDIETTGLSPTEDSVEVVTIAFAGGDARVYKMSDDEQRDKALTVLNDNMERTLVAHNAAFELSFLEAQLGYTHAGPVFCTMVASQIEAGGEDRTPAPTQRIGTTKAGKPKFGKADRPHSLRSAVYRWSGGTILLDKTEQTSDWSGELTESQLAYAKQDVEVLPMLARELRAAIADVGTVELDMRNVKVSAALAVRGVRFDVEEWRANAQPHKAEVERIDAELDELSGAAGNWNSNAQKLALLKAHGLSLPNAQAATIKAYRETNDVAALLADRAEHYKAATTYGDMFIDKNVDSDGRVRTSYRVYGAATGRYSSSNPNLQNIPRDKEFRRCFVPDEGVFVIADFSQIEVRYIAAFSGDEALQDALATGDVYEATARKILGIPGDEPVAKDKRQLAKAVVLGLQYGMGAPKFQKYAKDTFNVSITLDQAQEFKAKFFEAYPTLRSWQRDVGDPFDPYDPPEDGTSTDRTPMGRVRKGIRTFMERINFPIQGSAADAQKLALAELYDKGYDVVLHVHDEIVVECAESETATVAQGMQAIMEQAALDALPKDRKVHVPAEPSIGRSWADKS